MTEVWLRANTRAIGLGMVVPAVATVVGVVLAAGFVGSHVAIRVAGAALAVLAALVMLSLGRALWLPRLALEGDHLLVYLGHQSPLRVPLEIVECFLLGQAPVMLRGRALERAEARTVVIRLAERAEDWARRDVKPAFGKWCEGYITIRGTWCEPLDTDLVRRLNQWLADAHQRQSAKTPTEAHA